jgi:hypothetical protein
MKLQGLERWGNLSDDDLHNNDITAVSSEFLEEIRESLRRKRYIDNTIQDVRAVLLRCCRPPDLRCSRNMRNSWPMSIRERERFWNQISSHSLRKTTHRNG